MQVVRSMVRLAVVAVFAGFTVMAYADVTGRVVAVTDGDTIKVLDR